MHERCAASEMRNASGKCVNPDTFCLNECGEAGGEFNEIVGLCICKGRPDTLKECNSVCLQTVSHISLHGDESLVVENRGDPAGAPSATLSISSLQPRYLAGTPQCSKGKICPVQMIDLTTGKKSILSSMSLYACSPQARKEGVSCLSWLHAFPKDT